MEAAHQAEGIMLESFTNLVENPMHISARCNPLTKKDGTDNAT